MPSFRRDAQRASRVMVAGRAGAVAGGKGPRCPGRKRGQNHGTDPGCGGRHRMARGGERPDAGSAVVEFIFLSLLLMVPLVYFVITVAQIQAGSFAVVGAADQAAKVFVAQPDAASGRAAAEQAVLLALADHGQAANGASIETHCTPADCLAAGTAVTVTVRLNVPLPFVPFNDGFRLNASQLTAVSTQTVGRFR